MVINDAPITITSSGTVSVRAGHMVRSLAGSDPQNWLQTMEDEFLIPEVGKQAKDTLSAFVVVLFAYTV